MQLVNDLFDSMGTEQKLTPKQLQTVMTTFDSSEDGFVQHSEL
jgi:hypothetical protein